MHDRSISPASLGFSLFVVASATAQLPTRVDTEGAPPQPIVETWDAPRPALTSLERLQPTRTSMLLASGVPSVGFVSTDEAPEGDMPRAHAFTPDGQTVLVVNRDTDTVTWLDVATRTVVATVGVGDFPTSIAVAPDGVFAVVTNVVDNTVTVIDVAGQAAVATIPVTGLEPYAVEITADSTLAVVGVINDAINSAISVIDLGTLTEARSIPTGSQGTLGFFFTPETGIFGNLFTEFAVSPDSTTLVLPDRPNSQVALYDIRTGVQTALIPTPILPTAVDIDLTGVLAVVSHEGAAQAVSRINLLTGTTLGGAIAVGQNLVNQVIRLTPSGAFAIVAVQNAVRFVDLTTGLADPAISTGTAGDIGITADGLFAFVSNTNARILDVTTRTLVRTIAAEAGAEVAMSPTANIAVHLNNRFRENVVFFDANGASGSLLGSVQSGAPNEGDATRRLALSPDGETLLACNVVSGNVTILDAESETVRSYVQTGDRCWDAKVTPDGAFAVVTNTDASTVSIIDLATDTRVANLSVPTRPAELEISPDGNTAYVATIAGTDRIAFVDLNGAASAVTGSLATGQMGSTNRGDSVFSGIALSPDGSTLAVCVSFTDELLLIDTATRTEFTRVPVGDFPLRVAFSPDGALAFVANAFGDSVTVVAVAGAGSIPVTTIAPIEAPFELVVDADGAFTYVGSFDFSNPNITVLDNTLLTIATTVPLTLGGSSGQPRTLQYSGADDVLYVTSTENDLYRISAAGPASAVLDRPVLEGSAFDLAFSESLRKAFTAQPGVRDGVDVVRFGGLFENFGVGAAGTGGIVPELAGAGIPTPGAAVTISTSNGLSSALGTYLVGLSEISFPLLGATVLVLPFVDVPHGLDGSGAFALPLTIGGPNLLGIDVLFQGIYVDPGAPTGGLSFTDGLAMRIR